MTTTTKTRYETISLDAIAWHAADMDCDALRPGDEDDAVIVEMRDGRITEIVDGYHRTAGYVAWARDEDRSLDSVSVRVLVCDERTDEDLVATASEPGDEQPAALEALYAAAQS